MYTYTLYTPVGNFRAFPALIVAEFCTDMMKVNVETHPQRIEIAAETLSPTGKLPLLVVRDKSNHNKVVTVIFSWTAIARYLVATTTTSSGDDKNTTTSSTITARQHLLGLSSTTTNNSPQSYPEQTAIINYWIDWATSTIELPACLVFYPVVGYLPSQQQQQQQKGTNDDNIQEKKASCRHQARQTLHTALQVLEDQLTANRNSLLKSNNKKKDDSSDDIQGWSSIVPSSLSSSTNTTNNDNDYVTLADIVIASILVYPFKFECLLEEKEPELSSSTPTTAKPATSSSIQTLYPNTVQWFQYLISLPQFKAVIGPVDIV